MSLVELTASYVDHLLSSLGTGVKTLLLDSSAMAAISLSCPQSSLMAKGVYLFEKLSEAKSPADSLSFASCLCLLSPGKWNKCTQ